MAKLWRCGYGLTAGVAAAVLRPDRGVPEGAQQASVACRGSSAAASGHVCPGSRTRSSLVRDMDAAAA